MNRIFSFLLCAVFFFFFSGCASKSYLPKEAEFDKRFVGIWRGELSLDNFENLRRWKKKRRADGGLVVNVSVYGKEMTYLGREILSGFWWVQGNQYFEKLPTYNHLVVVHDFEVQDDGSIQFIFKPTGTESKKVYSFTEQNTANIE